MPQQRTIALPKPIVDRLKALAKEKHVTTKCLAANMLEMMLDRMEHAPIELDNVTATPIKSLGEME